ncbi:aldo/keto reductase [Christensenellaceae bacterium OttesenSCG-928-K19]|nr:aldo/keto reductase [Christensenellaceae bacterium OttesenSCG-928-K19]
MEYREIADTGWKASVIGLGTEHLDGKPYETVEETIHEAMKQGINMMDLFMPGDEVRKNIGRAIAGNREKFLIQGHICSTDINEQYDISRDLDTVKRYFENLLRHLDTDYIDFGMLFFIDTEENFKDVFETEILRYAQDLKRQGVVRRLGASSHNPVTARRIVETGEIDLLMFSINPAFDMMGADMILDDMVESVASASGIEPARAALYQACERQGVSISVMKTLGAGKLLSKEHSPFGDALSVGQCIHYALERPAVVSTLLGCKSAEEVRHAVSYFDLNDEEKDYSEIISNTEGNFQGSCVYCNHCLPCPVDIDIASVNRYLDIALLDKNNIPKSIVQHYSSLKAHGSDCIRCGSCEGRCPFSVPVTQRMETAAAVFGE